MTATASTPLSFRKAELGDAEPLWTLRTRAIRGLCSGFYPPADVESWAATPMPPKLGQVLVLQRAIVVEDGRGPIAFGFLDRDDGEVAAVYVSPDVARRGVGRALLAALESEAFAFGLRRLRLASSLNAVSFYEAAGYSVERADSFKHPAGFDLACVRMAKSLVVGAAP